MDAKASRQFSSIVAMGEEIDPHAGAVLYGGPMPVRHSCVADIDEN